MVVWGGEMLAEWEKTAAGGGKVFVEDELVFCEGKFGSGEGERGV